jgi:YedE family putative selenium metabolism protein
MSDRLTRFFASRWGLIPAGAVIGVPAPFLQKLGNPASMGICVAWSLAACFERDIAGAVGPHCAAAVQYIRPEIIRFVLGALIAAYLFSEFRARAGSASFVRFVLGMLAMIGALTSLGCPWRALLRWAGGDLIAILGLAGLTFGVTIRAQFQKSGYTMARSGATPRRKRAAPSTSNRSGGSSGRFSLGDHGRRTRVDLSVFRPSSLVLNDGGSL